MARVLVTGATGMIGTALVARLQGDGHEVVPLVRSAPSSAGEAAWQPDRGVLDPAAVAGFDAVVHLAGAGIGDRRWSTDRKKLLYDSRIGPTSLLAETLAGLEEPPRVLISGSAIGYYGVRGEEILTEDASAGDDFLARLTVDWEAASEPAAEAGIRLVNIRTGLVIGPSGGFLEPMLPLFRLGVGGRVGSGRQWWSWISLDDEVDAIVHLLESEIRGPVNLVAPNPVTNAEFTSELGEVLGRPAVIPVPGFALDVRLGREMAALTALASQRVDSSRLVEGGYRFEHADVASALRSALER